MAKYGCVAPDTDTGATETTGWLGQEEYVKYNLNETWCESEGGKWDRYIIFFFKKHYEIFFFFFNYNSFKWDGENPECVNQPWSKANHLGNVEGTTVRGGKQAHYDWKLQRGFKIYYAV